MSTKLIFAFLLLSTLILGCKNPIQPSSSAPPTSRTFFCDKFDGSNEIYLVDATLMAISEHSAVYVEDGNGIDNVLAQSIADEFESYIYGPIRDSFAHESDVDGNGRVYLLLLDIVDGFAGSGGYVGGYFWGGNMLDLAYSNRAEMIYLDVVQVTPDTNDFYETTAHEFQHLVNFSETYIRGGGRQFDTWINEGLSSAAQYTYSGQYDDSRLDYYNSDPGDSIRNGNTFFVWGNGNDWDLLADYSSVYIFFQWLRLQASNGSGIYREIIQSSEMDVQSVIDSMRTYIYDNPLIAWYEMLRDWNLAIGYGETSGLYGFQGEITPVIHDYSDTGTTKSLLSGESIYRVIPASPYTEASPPGDIHYLGIDGSDPSGLDDTGPDYDGSLLLVWNGSVSNTAPAVTVSIPDASYIAGRTAEASLNTDSALPLSYQIGVSFGSPRNRRFVRDDD